MSPTKQTKHKIIDAAMQLFYEQGYKGTTTKAIAERANISEVTLFRYFHTKEELFFAVIDRETNVAENLLAVNTDPSADLVSDLTGIGQYMFENMIARAKLMKILHTEASTNPHLFDRISAAPFGILEKLTEYFTKAQEMGLVRDINPYLAAVTFFSFFFRSLVVHAFLGRDIFLEIDNQVISDFAALFVNGIAER